jgi:hypothetical protein
MEPAKEQVVYTLTTKVLTVDKDNSNEWYFETLDNRFWTCMDRPPFNPGDLVKITISKEPK